MQPDSVRERSMSRAEMILFLLAPLSDEATEERVQSIASE